MSLNDTKKKRTYFILSSIFFAMASIAFISYVCFFCMTVSGIINYDKADDLGTGLQKVFGLVFSMISGGVILVSVGFSFIFSAYSKPTTEMQNYRRAIRVYDTLNLIYVALSVISFIAAVIFV